MNEQSPTPEAPNYTREQVVEAYKKFPERGFTNPYDIPLDDPEFIAANNIHDAWVRQEEDATKNGPPEAQIESELSRSTIFVDAGFLDPDYLDEVTYDFLAQDLQTAEDAGLTELASRIQAKIDQIEALIPKN